MTTWLRSDDHFNHANIIKYCNRPFASKEEMNEALIANHNALVKPNDEVFDLGDFAFGSPDAAIDILERLNGRFHFVRGNHDQWMDRLETRPTKKIVWIKQYHEFRDHGKVVACLFHYPIASWQNGYRGSYMLHGHTHGNHKFSLPRSEERGRIMDMGVDCHAYKPVSWEEVRERLDKLPPFNPEVFGEVWKK